MAFIQSVLDVHLLLRISDSTAYDDQLNHHDDGNRPFLTIAIGLAMLKHVDFDHPSNYWCSYCN